MNPPLVEATTYGAALAGAGAIAAEGIARATRERIAERLGGSTRKRSLVPSVARFGLGSVGVATACTVAGVLGWVIAGPVGVVLASVGWALGVRRIRARRAERLAEAAEAQIADLVAAMGAATRAGRSLRGSLEEATTDLDPPLSDLVRDALGRLATGEPAEAALERISRISSDGRLLVALLGVHARTGGELPRLLDELGSIVIRRVEARRQARALSAQARASGAVLASLPIAFVGLLSGVGGGGLGDLYRTPAGALLLASGLGLDWVGFAWLRRIAATGERG